MNAKTVVMRRNGKEDDDGEGEWTVRVETNHRNAIRRSIIQLATNTLREGGSLEGVWDGSNEGRRRDKVCESISSLTNAEVGHEGRHNAE